MQEVCSYLCLAAPETKTTKILESVAIFFLSTERWGRFSVRNISSVANLLKLYIRNSHRAVSGKVHRVCDKLTNHKSNVLIGLVSMHKNCRGAPCESGSAVCNTMRHFAWIVAHNRLERDNSLSPQSENNCEPLLRKGTDYVAVRWFPRIRSCFLITAWTACHRYISYKSSHNWSRIWYRPFLKSVVLASH